MSANETDQPFEFTYARKVVRRSPATDAQIAAVEARFGAIPADYKRFLQSVNGGSPRAKHAPALDEVDPPDADDPGRCVVDYPDYSLGAESLLEVECFYGLGPPEDAYEIEYYSKWPSHVLGSEVVAIAGNGAGDHLIFLAPGDPVVYLWLHDAVVPPVRIATSFSELLRLVRSVSDSRVMTIKADYSITDVIAALDSFEPSGDGTDNQYRLYQLFEGFRSLPDRDRAAPAMFGLLERFPDAEFGSPGRLVRELEAIPSYLPLLRDSVRRQPTYVTVWMVNRALNTRMPKGQRASWRSELRAALEHPLASEKTRRFVEDILPKRQAKS